jgi:toxin ParE1/3/4
VKVAFRQSARDDIIRQFRYYLLESAAPEVAIRFRESVRRTIDSLRQHPFIGAHLRMNNPLLREMRSWPVTGFEAIRIYYRVEGESLQIVRVLHGKRDIEHVIAQE